MNETTFMQSHPIFTTREFAMLCRRPVTSASHSLTRKAKTGAVARLTRGVWVQPSHPEFTPSSAIPYLLGNEQGYLSFLSAMHRHGLISQIPGSVQIATTGHTRRLTTEFGRYEFLHLKPMMMRDGVVLSETKHEYPIACPEKALLDTLYISTRKGRRFSSLPELELDEINAERFFLLLENQVSSKSIYAAIRLRAEGLGL